ncbi:MAG: c-type cytochrome [Gammaproteobacteria bacterium]|nr:c-type cytochrome [Gammaproteobacteria bacterium]
MLIVRILLVSILTGLSAPVIAELIPFDKLPKVNGFTIMDGEDEQYLAATDKGLFYSQDQGRTWGGFEGFELPATMITKTSQGSIYAFVAAKGLALLDRKTRQWRVVNNEFGSQYLLQLTTTNGIPARMVALNQYGKFLVSDNYGIEWQKMSGKYQPRTAEEERGQKIYMTICQSCHGKDGVGENYSIQSLTDKKYISAPALDASAHAWHHTDDDLVKTILEGSPRSPRMAAWKKAGITEQDARDLVSYMKSLWTQRELDCQGPKHMECMN